MKRAVSVLLMGFLLGFPLQPVLSEPAQGAPARPASAANLDLRQRLGGLGDILVEGRALQHPEVLRSFYAQRGFSTVWTEAGGPGVQATILAGMLANAAREGLDPADYHLALIEPRMTAPTPEHRAELELLLTDSLIHYALHLRTGRVLPRSIDDEHAIEPPVLDPLAIAKGAADAPDIAEFLRAFTPRHPDYAVLREALAEYRSIAARGGWPLAGGGPVLKSGIQDASVPALRRRLAATGEYAGADLASDIYDAELEAAVRLFQEKHGLVPDGIVGGRTRTEMNASAERRADQIMANMERLRWLPDDMGARYVAVNLPTYSLVAVENGEVRLQMPVIVGSAVRQTPILKSRIGHVVFNPSWTVPETIAKKDMLPRLVKDPGSLLRDGIQIYDGWAEDAPVVDPYMVDWSSVGSRITRYKIRQEPGPNNPLGQIKFMFANDFDVYLHDTPQREKFNRVVRSLSSGCVRVGDPEALTGFLFAGMPEWTLERRQSIKGTGRTKTVWLKRPVPVYLLYQTVVAEPQGGVSFRADLYERDQLLLAVLAKRGSSSLRLASARNG